MRATVTRTGILRVNVSEGEVRAFADRWPGFGRVQPMAFYFDTAGNLVDCSVPMGSGHDEYAIRVLSEDAGRYARGVLNPEPSYVIRADPERHARRIDRQGQNCDCTFCLSEYN